MKFLLITFALIGIAAAALPDSATQGPNPQDIATPEPEYIDIDLPELPPPKPAPQRTFSFPQRNSISAPATFQKSYSAPATYQRHFTPPRPVPQPIISSSSFSAPVHHTFHQQSQQQPIAGHTYSAQSGYHYKRPMKIIRRIFYHRYY